MIWCLKSRAFSKLQFTLFLTFLDIFVTYYIVSWRTLLSVRFTPLSFPHSPIFLHFRRTLHSFSWSSAVHHSFLSRVTQINPPLTSYPNTSPLVSSPPLFCSSVKDTYLNSHYKYHRLMSPPLPSHPFLSPPHPITTPPLMWPPHVTPHCNLFLLILIAVACRIP